MSHRTNSNHPSLVDELDDHINRNLGKVKVIGERLDSLGESLEDFKRKNILARELLVIIQQTLDLQKKQAALFLQPSHDQDI